MVLKREGGGRTRLEEIEKRLEDIRRENREASAEKVRQQQAAFGGLRPRLAAVSVAAKDSEGSTPQPVNEG